MKKIIIAVITGLALVVGLAPGAHAAQKYSVSMSISKTAIKLGSTLTISGRVSPNASGKKVSIQKKLAGGVWKTEAKVTVQTNGTYSYTVRPATSSTRQYRVYKAKSGAIKLGYSRVVTVRIIAPQKAGLAITSTGATSLDAGGSFVVNGKSSGNLRGKKVYLQLLRGRTWSTLAGGKVSAGARFALKAKATGAGANQKIRVYAPATSSTKAAASSAKVFKVYGWYYLADLDWIDSSWFTTSTSGIAGTTYPKAVHNYDFGRNESFREWGINYKCTQLRATIGLTDTSTSGAVGAFATRVDSVETDQGSHGVGTARTMVADLTGGYRLRLIDRYVSGSRNAEGAWGNARIRCAF